MKRNVLFQYLSILLFCVTRANDSPNILTFEIQNSKNGTWQFQEDSTVILVCEIFPYKEIQTFFYNSLNVFGCNFGECSNATNNQREFSFAYEFKNDAVHGVNANGTFTWKITPVKMTFNGQLFKCSSNDENKLFREHTMTVIPKEQPTSTTTSSDAAKWSGRYYVGITTLVIIVNKNMV